MGLTRTVLAVRLVHTPDPDLTVVVLVPTPAHVRLALYIDPDGTMCSDAPDDALARRLVEWATRRGVRADDRLSCLVIPKEPADTEVYLHSYGYPRAET